MRHTPRASLPSSPRICTLLAARTPRTERVLSRAARTAHLLRSRGAAAARLGRALPWSPRICTLLAARSSLSRACAERSEFAQHGGRRGGERCGADRLELRGGLLQLAACVVGSAALVMQAPERQPAVGDQEGQAQTPGFRQRRAPLGGRPRPIAARSREPAAHPCQPRPVAFLPVALHVP